MLIAIKAHDTELTPSLHAYAEKKLRDDLAPLCGDSATRLDVQLAVEHGQGKEHNQCCRIDLFVPHVGEIVIKEADDDMYKAIDKAHDRLLQAVKHQRERKSNMHRVRKDAEKERALIARANLTHDTEDWEREEAEFEGMPKRRAQQHPIAPVAGVDGPLS